MRRMRGSMLSDTSISSLNVVHSFFSKRINKKHEPLSLPVCSVTEFNAINRLHFRNGQQRGFIFSGRQPARLICGYTISILSELNQPSIHPSIQPSLTAMNPQGLGQLCMHLNSAKFMPKMLYVCGLLFECSWCPCVKAFTKGNNGNQSKNRWNIDFWGGRRHLSFFWV